jgi:hypothetical protein
MFKNKRPVLVECEEYENLMKHFDILGFSYALASELPKAPIMRKAGEKKTPTDKTVIDGFKLISDLKNKSLEDINDMTVYFRANGNRIMNSDGTKTYMYESNNSYPLLCDAIKQIESKYNFYILQKSAWNKEQKIRERGAISFDEYMEIVLNQNYAENSVKYLMLDDIKTNISKDICFKDLRLQEYFAVATDEHMDIDRISEIYKPYSLFKSYADRIKEKYQPILEEYVTLKNSLQSIFDEYYIIGKAYNSWVDYDKRQRVVQFYEDVLECRSRLKMYEDKFGKL